MNTQSHMLISFENKDAEVIQNQLKALLGSDIEFKLSDEAQALKTNAIDLGSQNNDVADDIVQVFKNLGIAVVVSCSNCDSYEIEDWTVKVKQSANGEWLTQEATKTESIISDVLSGLLNQIEAEDLSVEQIKSKIRSMI